MKLQEAAQPPDFLGRVKALDQGEVARLAGGVGVKRLALEDGRDAYRVAGPSTYGRSEPQFDYGQTYRTAEEAVRYAFRRSAESTDPESLGGATRLVSYVDVTLAGEPVRVRDWTTDGRAIVSGAGITPGTLGGRAVDPAKLARLAPLAESAEPFWLEGR